MIQCQAIQLWSEIMWKIFQVAFNSFFQHIQLYISYIFSENDLPNERTLHGKLLWSTSSRNLFQRSESESGIRSIYGHVSWISRQHNYRKISNIRRTNPTTWMFLVSACRCLCTIYWSQVLSGELRCSWSSADRRCSNCIWVISNWIAYYNSSYIRGMTVHYLGNGLVPLGDDLWWPRTMPPYGVTRKQLS